MSFNDWGGGGKEGPVENIVGNGEYAGNQHLLLFPTQCFPHYQMQKKKNHNLSHIINCLQNAFSLDKNTFLSSGKELN